MSARGRSGGFTLIEAMIVVTVLAIIAAIAFPTYGNYVIRGLPRRRAQLVATHASGASELVDIDLTSAARATADLVLSIDGAIDGTVVTSSGEPVPEAQVMAEPQWSGNITERERWGVRGDQYRIADAGGRFHIGGLPAGSYRVRAARPGTSESMLWTQVGQVVPRYVLHDIEVRPAVLSAVEGRHDVGVRQAGGGLDFPAKASHGVGIAHQFRRKHLERHQPGLPLPTGFVDDSHSPFADPFGNHIIAESHRLRSFGAQRVRLIAGNRPLADEAAR